MSNQKDIREGTRQLIGRCRRERDPYVCKIEDLPLIVLPNVFSPKYFKGTEFYAIEVSHRARLPFLDMGTGTGAVACIVALSRYYRHARSFMEEIRESRKGVLAVDSNPSAVRNAKINSVLCGLEKVVEVKQSDIYSSIGSNKKFWTIFWNAPFFDEWDGENDDMLTRATYDPEYYNLIRFVNETREHLFNNGNLLIGFQTSPEKRKVLDEIVIEAGFEKPKLVAETGYKRYGVRLEFGLYETRRR